MSMEACVAKYAMSNVMSNAMSNAMSDVCTPGLCKKAM